MRPASKRGGSVLRRVGRTENNSWDAIAAMFFIGLLAATLAFIAPVSAQENNAKQGTVPIQEATAAEARAEDTTAQSRDVEAGKEKDSATAKSQSASSVDSKQQVASAQVAQGEVKASRAADPLASATAQIVETNSDAIVNRIIVTVSGCVVGENATVTVKDSDGTPITFRNGNGVTITSTQDRIVIQGTEESGNIGDADFVGGDDPNFSPGTGTAIRSAGITCSEDADDTGTDNGTTTGDNPTLAGGCTTLRLFEGDERESETFGIPSDSTGRLRIVYSTLNDDGELAISVGTVQTRASGLSETVRGSESGVIRGSVDDEAQIAISVVPTDQDYRIVLESIGGDDECTTPKAVRGVLTESIPDDEQLPETGGVPLSVLAGCVALLLVGTAVVGSAARRRM